MSDLPARVGRYRIERSLGAGGMGVVFLGRDEATGAAAAVKLLRPEYTADPRLRARLRREVAAARRVPRSCTAPVLDADLDAEQPWVATEYVDGPTLDAAVLDRGRLAGPALETFAVGVAVALRAIHEHGVVHRDLKPSNVLLSVLGPRVIDFGIAQVEGAQTRLTRTGAVVGTPAFMAPEQRAGAPVTAAADVFAWAGVVTYAATGLPPAGTGNLAPDLTGVAGPLRELVAAALAPDPARRPSTTELVDRLSRVAPAAVTRVLATAAAPAPPPPRRRPRRPRRPRRRSRRRVLAAALAAGLAVAGAATAGAVALVRDGDPPGAGELHSRALAGESLAVAASDPRRAMGLALDAWAAAPTQEARGALLSAATGDSWLPHPSGVFGVAYAPGGDRVATAGQDGLVRIWDPTTGEVTGTVTHADQVRGLAYAPDGSLASTSVDGEVRLRDPAGRERGVLTVDGGREPLDAAFSPDGELLAVSTGPPVRVDASHQIRLWRTDPPRPLRTVELGEADPQALAFTPDGARLVAVTHAFSVAGGAYRASSELLIWRLDELDDLDSGRRDPLGPDQLVGLAVSPDGATLAVAGTNQVVQLHRLAGDRPVREIAPHDAPVRDVAYSPDGRTLATITTREAPIRLWDAETGDLVATLTGHDEAPNAIAFSPDGRTLASAGPDGFAAVWPTHPDDAVARICQALDPSRHPACA